jgi:hypothetical protein
MNRRSLIASLFAAPLALVAKLGFATALPGRVMPESTLRIPMPEGAALPGSAVITQEQVIKKINEAVRDERNRCAGIAKRFIIAKSEEESRLRMEASMNHASMTSESMSLEKYVRINKSDMAARIADLIHHPMQAELEAAYASMKGNDSVEFNLESTGAAA